MNTLAQINNEIEVSNSNTLTYEYFDYRNSITPRLTENNESIYNTIESFRLLKDNWDSYNAIKPSDSIIKKSIDLLIWLNASQIDVYFSAPTRDGDVLLELKNNDKSVEFIMSNSVDDIVCLINNDDANESKFYYHNLHLYIQFLFN